MIPKEVLFTKLNQIDTFAAASKFHRFIHNPVKYSHAILFRALFYKSHKKAKSVICNTFFGSSMHLLLPASTDIYLTGGKSHFSETKLARFLIKNLKTDDVFIDVGAHYGYFSLLASKLIGEKGKVFSFEAAPTTFKVLQKNLTNNITIFNKAISDTRSNLTFYEFPNLYCEYNSFDIEQFKEEPWFESAPPKKVLIESETLDSFFLEMNIIPNIIKIDVEGAEYKVLKGGSLFLKKNTPLLVMEYLSNSRGNSNHFKAAAFLKKLGFQSYAIDQHGSIQLLEDIAAYLQDNHLESDNIVFKK